MEIIINILTGALMSVINMAKIVIPVMVALELAKKFNVLDKLARGLKPITNFFGMERKSGLLLMIGLVFGLAYGAGAIIQYVEEGEVNKRDLVLLMAFLSLCHAVPEDTLLFVEAGGKGIVILGSRLLAATLVTYVMSKRIKTEEQLGQWA